MLMLACALVHRKFEECFPKPWIQTEGREEVEKKKEKEEERMRRRGK